MTKEHDLLRHVKTVMRVMLISERTPPEHQHIIKFNPLDFHTLGMVRTQPGVRSSEVAGSLGIAATTASSVIGRLINRGWIERTQSEGDRRAYDLTLTTEGQRIADAIHEQDVRDMTVFLSALTVTEQDELIRLLGKVARRVEALEMEG
ncbi:MarR family transcriptional regulator [Tateyamaria omphalii]|uniref:MarR family winged helix-turn-helix transcriptional regulator n=1 Tax=Tateyamaria omphalii TaxID=299262 RepID=UPI001C99C412|nr:MarR family transcriptional regulator [Tateyamaria omphalii]MBY5931871.1 MarR family transcriptional regulator [Tateyamaria omphalii]